MGKAGAQVGSSCSWGPGGFPQLGSCTGGSSAPLTVYTARREAEPRVASPPKPSILLWPDSIPSWAGWLQPIPMELRGPHQAPPQVLLGAPARWSIVARACRAPGQPHFPPRPCLPKSQPTCGASPCTYFSPPCPSTQELPCRGGTPAAPQRPGRAGGCSLGTQTAVLREPGAAT